MTPFASAYTSLAVILGSVASNYSNGLLPVALALLSAGGVIYFIVLGYMVVRGVVSTPITELGMSALKFGLVVALLGATGFVPVVINAANTLPAELISAGSGTPVANPGATMDGYFRHALQLTASLKKKWDDDRKTIAGAQPLVRSSGH